LWPAWPASALRGRIHDCHEHRSSCRPGVRPPNPIHRPWEG
jgi:hypothetical protein